MTKKNPIKTPKISKKPSVAIKQAVADLTAVEKMKAKYIVNMDVFHESLDNDKCEVCFAGAVIAQAGNDSKLNLGPNSFSLDVNNKLSALDSFRSGDVMGGLDLFGVKIPKILQGKTWDEDSIMVDVVEYSEDPKQFKKDMLAIASDLEKLGL